MISDFHYLETGCEDKGIKSSFNVSDAFKNVPNPCTDNPSQKVYFPHPTDSAKFIQCDRYGRMYIIQCPQSLLYR